MNCQSINSYKEESQKFFTPLNNQQLEEKVANNGKYYTSADRLHSHGNEFT